MIRCKEVGEGFMILFLIITLPRIILYLIQ